MRGPVRVSLPLLALALLIFASAFPCRAEKLADLRGVYACFNHDGSRVVVRNGGVQIWDVTTGKMVTVDAALKTATTGPFVSGDGKRFVAGFADGTARLFDATTGKPLSPSFDRLPTSEAGTEVLFAPDGATLLISGEKESALFNVSTGKRILTIPMAKADDMQMASGSAEFAAGGALCFAINASGEVTRYDTKDGKQIGKPIKHPAADSAMDFFQFVSEDGKWLVTSDFPGENGPKGNVQVWDVEAEKPLGEPLETMNGWTACFLGNTRVLLIPERPGENAKINAHDLPSMNVAYAVGDHEDLDGPHTAVSPDGKWLVTWAPFGTDRLVNLYDIATGKLEGRFEGKSEASTVDMAPDSSGCFVTFKNSPFEDQGYHDYYVMQLSFPELKASHSLRFTDPVASTSLSPDGKRFMVKQGEKDKERLLFYDAATLKPLK